MTLLSSWLPPAVGLGTVVLATVALATPSGLTPPSEPLSLPLEVVEVPLSAGSPLTDIAVGDFDGDGRPDAVVLAAGTPIVIWGPAVYEAATRLSAASTGGVTVVTNAGGTDLIVTASAAGLHAWTYAPEAGSAFQSIELSPDPFGSVAPMDVGGVAHAAALAADGKSAALVAVDTGQLTGTIDFGGTTAWHLAPIDWDGEPGQELAVLVDQSVLVFDALGQLLQAETTDGRSLQLHPLQTADGPALAWLQEDALGTTTEVHLLGASPCAPSAVTSVVPGTLSAGDLTGDGADELAFVSAATGRLVVLGGPCLASPSPMLSGPPLGAPTSTGSLVFLDVDNDGDLDGLGGALAGSLGVYRNGSGSGLGSHLRAGTLRDAAVGEHRLSAAGAAVPARQHARRSAAGGRAARLPGGRRPGRTRRSAAARGAVAAEH